MDKKNWEQIKIINDKKIYVIFLFKLLSCWWLNIEKEKNYCALGSWVLGNSFFQGRNKIRLNKINKSHK